MINMVVWVLLLYRSSVCTGDSEKTHTESAKLLPQNWIVDGIRRRPEGCWNLRHSSGIGQGCVKRNSWQKNDGRRRCYHGNRKRRNTKSNMAECTVHKKEINQTHEPRQRNNRVRHGSAEEIARKCAIYFWIVAYSSGPLTVSPPSQINPFWWKQGHIRDQKNICLNISYISWLCAQAP